MWSFGGQSEHFEAGIEMSLQQSCDLAVRSSHGSCISKMLIVVLCVCKYKCIALSKEVGILLCLLQDGMGKYSFIQKNVFMAV